MSASSDLDFFRVDLPAGKTLTAKMTPNSTSDYDLYMLSSTGAQLSASEAGKGAVDTVTKANTGSSAMTLYVKVVYYSGGTGATSGKYSLNLNW